MVATCERCGRLHDSVTKCQKLNPRNLKPAFLRVCDPCRKTDGWTRVDTGRAYAEASRPW